MQDSEYPSEYPIEAILFDKDGTLADARPFLRNLAIARAKACADAFEREVSVRQTALHDWLCQAFGVTLMGLDPDGLMAVATRAENEQAAVDLIVSVGGASGRAKALVPQIFAEVDRVVPSKAAATPPFPETRDMLRKLNRRSIKVGVLSSDSTSNVADFLHHYGYNTLVNNWRGTEAGDLPKPEPQLFWELCDRMQVTAHQTIMVGDSWADVAVARNAGAAAFVSVSETWGRAPLLGADYVIQDWNHLLTLVDLIGKSSSVPPSC
jgi:phosphoglycolate phosphatase